MKITIIKPECPYIGCEFTSNKRGPAGPEEIYEHMKTCRSYENHTEVEN